MYGDDTQFIKTLKPGDPVVIVTRGGMRDNREVGAVVKVTPKGHIVVHCGKNFAGEPIEYRFNPDGGERRPYERWTTVWRSLREYTAAEAESIRNSKRHAELRVMLEKTAWKKVSLDKLEEICKILSPSNSPTEEQQNGTD